MKYRGVNRREYERSEIEGKAFAVLYPGYTRVGRLLDISMNGLGFWYLAGKVPSEQASELAIYMDDHRYLEDIPCKVVYDVELEKEPPASFMAKRKVGVQFGELTAGQVSKLNSFIREKSA